jgi:hypothetical protein
VGKFEAVACDRHLGKIFQALQWADPDIPESGFTEMAVQVMDCWLPEEKRASINVTLASTGQKDLTISMMILLLIFPLILIDHKLK